MIAFLLSMAAGTAGRLLKDARRQAGMSQRALALAAGVPQSTIARIELAEVSPRVDTLERLLRKAGRTLATETRPDVDQTVILALRQLTPTQRLKLGSADSKTFRQFERDARRRAGLPALGIPRSMDIEQLDLLVALQEVIDDEGHKGRD